MDIKDIRLTPEEMALIGVGKRAIAYTATKKAIEKIADIVEAFFSTEWKDLDNHTATYSRPKIDTFLLTLKKLGEEL